MRLKRGFAYLAAVSLAAGSAIAVAVPHALAAGDVDNLNPAMKKVVGTSPATGATEFTAQGQINGIPVTVKCAKTTLTTTTPKKGLGPAPLTAAFSSCTDSLGGKDTVKTSGKWNITFIDAANDEAAEARGDMLSVTIPANGATFKSTILPTCTVIVAAGSPFTFTSAYDDVKTATVNVPLPTSGSGCTTTPTAQTNATYTLNPGVKDVS